MGIVVVIGLVVMTGQVFADDYILIADMLRDYVGRR
jgi:hypothetical protein